MTTSTCSEHGDALIWERGGPDMPTIFGRRYCPTCQALFMAALDTPELVCAVIACGRPESEPHVDACPYNPTHPSDTDESETR